MTGEQLWHVLVLGGVILIGSIMLPEKALFWFLFLLLVGIIVARWWEIEALGKSVSDILARRVTP